MNYELGKKYLAGFLIIMILSSGFFFLPAKKADAIPVTEVGENLWTNVVNTVQAIMDVAKEYGLDTIAWYIAQQLLKSMTDSLVTWIESGFDDNPMFFTNLQNNLGSAANQVSGLFIEELGLTQLCNPSWKTQIQLSLTYQKPFQLKMQCTLDKLLSNVGSTVNDFYDDFNKGGWDAWLVMTTQPQNNPYGAYITSLDELQRRQSEAQEEQKFELSMGSGTFSLKECSTVLTEASHPSGQHILKNPSDSFGNHCIKEDLTNTTPGTIINNQLIDSLGSGMRKLEAADEIDEIINALLMAGFDYVTKGLKSSNKRADDSPPAPRPEYINALISQIDQDLIYEVIYRDAKQELTNQLGITVARLNELKQCAGNSVSWVDAKITAFSAEQSARQAEAGASNALIASADTIKQQLQNATNATSSASAYLEVQKAMNDYNANIKPNLRTQTDASNAQSEYTSRIFGSYQLDDENARIDTEASQYDCTINTIWNPPATPNSYGSKNGNGNGNGNGGGGGPLTATLVGSVDYSDNNLNGFFSLKSKWGTLFAGTHANGASTRVYTYDGSSFNLQQDLNAGESVFKFIDAGSVLIAATESRGKIYRKTQTGNWQEVYDDPDYGMARGGDYLGNTIYVALDSGTGASRIVKSTDSGKIGTWSSAFDSSSVNIMDIITHGNYVIALGFRKTGSNNIEGVLYKATEGGSFIEETQARKSGERFFTGYSDGTNFYVSATKTWWSNYLKLKGANLYLWNQGQSLQQVVSISDQNYFTGFAKMGNTLYVNTAYIWNDTRGNNSYLYKSDDGVNFSRIYTYSEPEAWDLEMYNGSLYSATRAENKGGKVYKMTGGTVSNVIYRECKDNYNGGNFLWKPIAESGSKLVVLLPKGYPGGASGPDGTESVVEIHSFPYAGGQAIETGQYKGRFEGRPGDRPIYRFNLTGGSYCGGGPCVLLVTQPGGGTSDAYYIKETNTRCGLPGDGKGTVSWPLPPGY